MPRFTYKDWVGRKARCLRRMRNRADPPYRFEFKEGEVVNVMGYDPYLSFSIQKGKRFLWKVRPHDIELIDNPVLTLDEKIIAFIKQATVLDAELWVGAPDIARGVQVGLASVSSALKRMCERESSLWINVPAPRLIRMAGQGKRGGYGYRLPGDFRFTALDFILCERDLV